MFCGKDLIQTFIHNIHSFIAFIHDIHNLHSSHSFIHRIHLFSFTHSFIYRRNKCNARCVAFMCKQIYLLHLFIRMFIY